MGEELRDGKSAVSDELYAVIGASWENGQYTETIRQAMLHLSDLIRDRSDCEDDGDALVTAALGGESPRIRINKLESKTDRSEHLGFTLLVKGLYLAVRNPRTHKAFSDKSEDAIKILGFIDWIAERVRVSEGTFSPETLLVSVEDHDFVDTPAYAEALWDHVPRRKRFEYLVTLYRSRGLFRKDVSPLVRMFDAWYMDAGNHETDRILSLFSENLLTVQTDQERRIILQLVHADMWGRIETAARLRTENRIVESIKSGKSYPTRKSSDGWLATWCVHLLPEFSNRQELLAVVGNIVTMGAQEEIRFVYEHVLRSLWRLISAKDVVRLNDIKFDDDFLTGDEFPAHVRNRIVAGSKFYYDLTRRQRSAMPDYVSVLFEDAIANFAPNPEADPPSESSEIEDDVPF